MILVLFCDEELDCVGALIRAHSLILWFVSPRFCLQGKIGGEIKDRWFHLCDVYLVGGDTQRFVLTKGCIHLCKESCASVSNVGFHPLRGHRLMLI